MTTDHARYLTRWAFEGIPFPGFEATTSGGHDSVDRARWRQRGVSSEPTGLRADVVRVRVELYNGLRGWTGDKPFPDLYELLLRTLRSTPVGELIHPSRGVMRVQVGDIEETLSPRTQDGLTLDLTFKSIDGESDVLTFASSTTSSPAEAIVSAAEYADARRVLGLSPANAAPITPTVESTLDTVSGGTFTQISAALDTLGEAINGRLDDPALIPPGAAELIYRAALWGLRTAYDELREQVLGEDGQTFTVPVEMSLAMIASLPEVLGDASRAGELAEVNAISDPSFIPAGTILRLVPL